MSEADGYLAIGLLNLIWAHTLRVDGLHVPSMIVTFGGMAYLVASFLERLL